MLDEANSVAVGRFQRKGISVVVKAMLTTVRVRRH